jgi:nucleoid DNA-binding protein
MNKSELIDAAAQGADISKAAAGKALDALTGISVFEVWILKFGF